MEVSDQGNAGGMVIMVCPYCYCVVLKEKMTYHWKRMHKDIKAADYL